VQLDVEYGNISEEQARSMSWACRWGVPDGYPAGATEPWITDLVAGFVTASGHRTVLETGGFQGHTSQALLQVLWMMGGGDLTVCELDPLRASQIEQRLLGSGIGKHLELAADWTGQQEILEGPKWRVRNEDALSVIRSLPDAWLGVAWVDDDHGKQHVWDEIDALMPKMATNGIILLHDVYGVTDLQEIVSVFKGYSLDLPRNGPAGGLGIIQCR